MIKNFETYINEDYFSKLANRKDNKELRSEQVNKVNLDNGKTLVLKNQYTAEIIEYLFDDHEDDDVYGLTNFALPSGNNWSYLNVGIDMSIELNSHGINSFNRRDTETMLRNAKDIFDADCDRLDEIIPSIKDFEELNEYCYIREKRIKDYTAAEFESKETGDVMSIRLDAPYVVLDENGQKKLLTLTLSQKQDTEEFDNLAFDLSEKNIKPFVNDDWIQFRPVMKEMWMV